MLTRGDKAYFLLCSVLFGVIMGGTLYAMTTLRYDPLTESKYSQQSFYAYNGTSGLHVVADGHDLPFTDNLGLRIAKGICEGISLTVSITDGSVRATMNQVPYENCQLPAPGDMAHHAVP